MFWALLSPILWVTGIKLRPSGLCYKRLYLLSHTISPWLESCLNTCLFVSDNTKDCFKSTGYKNHKELSQQPLLEQAGLRQQPQQEQVQGSYCLGSRPEPETSVEQGSKPVTSAITGLNQLPQPEQTQSSDPHRSRYKGSTAERAGPSQRPLWVQVGISNL